MTDAGLVSERVHSFIVEKFPLARKTGLKNGDKLLEAGIVDSLGILDLVSFLESEFSIQMSDEELLPENFQSIDCIAAFVQRKTKGTRSERT